MPFYKGKGYGENGEVMEDVILAENKYDAKAAFKEAFAGGVTVLQEVTAEQAAQEAGGPESHEEVAPPSDDPADTVADPDGGGDDTPPAAA